MSIYARFLPLVALASLVGCSGSTPDTGGDTADTDNPVTCDAADAVDVSVRNSRGRMVSDLAVTWSNGVDSGDCVGEELDLWHCDAPPEGDLTITATHPSYTTATQVVAAADGCRAGGESVTLELDAAGTHFEASRMYYLQLIEDDYECEHSWELYGVNCYATAAFCADGYSTIIVTDIVNGGVYDIVDDDTITNTLSDSGDMPTETELTITSETELTDWIGATWTLDTDGQFELYDCPA